MIKFEKVEVQNFNSLGHIDWEFSPGVHAVKGLNLDEEKFKSNGSGKSSLFDSVIWGIFGKTPTGKASDAVIHRGRGNNCFVKLWFSIGENEYRIERYRNHSDFSNDIKVFINEQDKTIHPPSKNQELIDKIIRVPFSLFTSSFIIAQGLDSRFTSMTDFQRKEVIESIRDNQIWEEARETNKTDFKKTKGLLDEGEKDIEFLHQHMERLDEEMKGLKTEIKDLMQEKSEYKSDNDTSEFQKELEKSEKEKEEVEKKIKDLEENVLKKKEEKRDKKQEEADQIPTEVSELKDELHQLERFSRITELQKEKREKEEEHKSEKKENLESIKSSLTELRDKKDKKLKEVETLKEKVTEKETVLQNHQKDKTQLVNDKKLTEEKITFYEHSLDEDHDAEECPTCGHIPEEDDLKKINSKLSDSKKELKEHKSKIEFLETKITKVEENLNSILEEKEKEQKVLNELIDLVAEKANLLEKRNLEEEAHSNSISKLQKQIDELTQKMSDEGLDHSDLEESKDKLSKTISEKEEKREKLLSEIKDIKKDITEELSKKEDLQNKIKYFDLSIESSKNKIKAIEDEISEFDSKIAFRKESIEKTADKKQTSLQEVQDIEETVTELKEKYDVLKTLDGIFSPKGIRAHIISKDISFLNERLDVYSKHFFNDMYIQLDPGVDEEGSVTKIDIPVSTTLNFDKTYEDCSGGEKRRIDISIQLAIFDLILSMSSVTTNLLVLDEVFEGLDDEGVKAVMEIVSGFGEETCVYVISHLPNLGEFVEDEFTFVKKQGTSYLSTDIEDDNFYEVQ